MDKPNIFKTSDFYMNEGDILHVLIKDFAGTPIALRLSESDSGVIEDGNVITDNTPINATVVLNEGWIGYLDVTNNGALVYVGDNILFLNLTIERIGDEWPEGSFGWVWNLWVQDASDVNLLSVPYLVVYVGSDDDPFSYITEITLNRDIVALDEITVTIAPGR